MKHSAVQLIPIVCLSLLLLGCGTINETLAERDKSFADFKHTLTQKQADYKTKTEQTTKYIAISADKYSNDLYGDIRILENTGFTIHVPTGGKETDSDRVSTPLPVSFECDYTKGETHGELRLSYQKQNSYRRIYAIVEASCIPLRPYEQSMQIAAEQKAAQLAEQEAQRRENERQLAEKRRAHAAKEEQERALRNTPQFKRNQAQQSIIYLRQTIEQAKQGMDYERQVGLVSGYINASRLHELGSIVVYAEREMQSQWRIYKANGGQATSLSKVK